MQKVNKLYKIFCFHHAGGSSIAYRKFERFISENAELVFIDFPGRAGTHELSAKDFDALLDYIEVKILERITPSDNIMLYGHSMGALVALETAKRLVKHSVYLNHLFISSCLSPREFVAPIRSKLSDEELLGVISSSGWFNASQLRGMTFKKYFLPVIRSDFNILEGYKSSYLPMLECPITCLGGDKDNRVSVDALQAWDQETAGRFDLRIFRGGHFYNLTGTELMIKFLNRKIESNRL